jgi:putative FmdB family regulatory protein
MPTYDYACPDCKHSFQKFHSMTADPIKDCPECQEKNVRRLIGAGAGLIFKGSGFYITDYRSKSYNEAKKNDSSAPSEPASGGSDSASKAASPPAATKTPSPPTKSSD